jgi:hypothetical protein
LSNPDASFVYRIGPLDVGGRTGNWYQVLPPTGDVFFGDDDAEMLAQIKAALPGRSLECEPALAAAGEPLGYVARPLDDEETNARARLWITIEAGAWFKGIDQITFALFLKFGTELSLRGQWFAAVVELEVDLRGPAYGVTFDETVGVVWTGAQGFFAFESVAAMRRFQELTVDGAIDDANDVPRWSLQYATGSAGLQDAMRAAYQAQVVPYAVFDGPDGRRAVDVREAWRVGLIARGIEGWVRAGAAESEEPLPLAGHEMHLEVRFGGALADAPDGTLVRIGWDQLQRAEKSR